MNADMERLIGELTQLRETIQTHKGDQSTLDMAAMETSLRNVVGEMMLVRKGDYVAHEEFIGADGRMYRDPFIKTGKFAGLRQSDLELTAFVLQRAAGLGVGKVIPPSAELVKALTSTGSATGAELVPTGMAAELWQDFFMASRVLANIPRYGMPTDPFDLPLGLGDVTWRKGTQNTATTASTPATAKSTLTTTEILAEVDFSYHLDEDAIIAVLPALRERLRISGGEAMDAFILNADSEAGATGNVNLDDAAPNAANYYLSAGQNGIRRQWIVDDATQTVAAGGDALTDADILNMLAKLGKYAANPARCIMVCDMSTYLKGFLGGLDGVQTIDKYGPAAVLVTGELARYRGVPIVPSASHPLGEADGKVSTTAGNNTLGSISVFNRDMWGCGFRRELMMEVDRDITKRMFILVTSFRIAVAAHGTRSTAIHTAGIANLLVA